MLIDERKIPALIHFAMPAMVGMVTGAIYNIVDRIFVGRYVGTSGPGRDHSLFSRNAADVFLLSPYRSWRILKGRNTEVQKNSALPNRPWDTR